MRCGVHRVFESRSRIATAHLVVYNICDESPGIGKVHHHEVTLKFLPVRAENLEIRSLIQKLLDEVQFRRNSKGVGGCIHES